MLDFRGTVIPRIDLDIPVPIQANAPKHQVEKLTNGVGFTCGNDKVIWLGLSHIARTNRRVTPVP
jgi:hypothetical protein